MIYKYGADAVRWFILSDSPPEKDIQWSDAGVSSSNKFLQKLWNLIIQILNRKENQSLQSQEIKLINKIDFLASKIDHSIENFKFNVTIANFYEAFNLLNKFVKLEVSNKCLKNNITKIMKLLMPIVPHLANETLDLLKCDTKTNWPNIKKDLLNEIKFAVQINGKTRDILTINRDTTQTEVELYVKEKSKAYKFIQDKKIIKTIFVNNKILNYIIK